MLFSSADLAQYINNSFEPAWESVRPAPLVTIDFGNGHVVKRTLQGNIATYVCGSDGTVYDVLPGIYAPDVYRKQLETLKVVATWLQWTGTPPPANDAEKRRAEAALATRLNTYHSTQANSALPPTPQMQAVGQIGGGFKGGFGGGFQGVPTVVHGGGFQFGGGFGGGNFGRGFQPAAGAAKISGFGAVTGAIGTGGIEGPTMGVIVGLPPTPVRAPAPQVPLAARPELKLDSEVNERIRRKDIHEKLARLGMVRPDDIKKWLYKDVLHADIDDPMLGLGSMLNANYPFAEEDRAGNKP